MNAATPRDGQAVTLSRTSLMTMNCQFGDARADEIAAQALSPADTIAAR